LLQRRLPDMAAQRYVKYLPTVRYGTYGSTGKGPKLPRERLPLYPARVLECWDKKLAIEQLCVDSGSN
jgi:hypothetical protein